MYLVNDTTQHDSPITKVIMRAYVMHICHISPHYRPRPCVLEPSLFLSLSILSLSLSILSLSLYPLSILSLPFYPLSPFLSSLSLSILSLPFYPLSPFLSSLSLSILSLSICVVLVITLGRGPLGRAMSGVCAWSEIRVRCGCVSEGGLSLGRGGLMRS
jgi:hypothetical protein